MDVLMHPLASPGLGPSDSRREGEARMTGHFCSLDWEPQKSVTLTLGPSWGLARGSEPKGQQARFNLVGAVLERVAKGSLRKRSGMCLGTVWACPQDGVEECTFVPHISPM